MFFFFARAVCWSAEPNRRTKSRAWNFLDGISVSFKRNLLDFFFDSSNFPVSKVIWCFNHLQMLSEHHMSRKYFVDTYVLCYWLRWEWRHLQQTQRKTFHGRRFLKWERLCSIEHAIQLIRRTNGGGTTLATSATITSSFCK